MMRMNLITKENEEIGNRDSFCDNHCHGNPMQAADLAYTAGIIDGEGYIGILRTKAQSKDKTPRFDPRVQVCMTDYNAPKFLHTLHGGTFYQRVRRNKAWKDTYVWTLTNKDSIRALLIAILPFMKTKVEQAKLVIEFLETCPMKRRGKTPVSFPELLKREQVRLEMNKLNLRGAAATTEPKDTREGEATV